MIGWAHMFCTTKIKYLELPEILNDVSMAMEKKF
jgi:hypothetical protein